MDGELLYKIIQRIEELLILTVAALDLSVVARRIGANQFMPDPQFGSRLLKQRRQSPRCIVVLHNSQRPANFSLLTKRITSANIRYCRVTPLQVHTLSRVVEGSAR